MNHKSLQLLPGESYYFLRTNRLEHSSAGIQYTYTRVQIVMAISDVQSSLDHNTSYLVSDTATRAVYCAHHGELFKTTPNPFNL